MRLFHGRGHADDGVLHVEIHRELEPGAVLVRAQHIVLLPVGLDVAVLAAGEHDGRRGLAVDDLHLFAGDLRLARAAGEGEALGRVLAVRQRRGRVHLLGGPGQLLPGGQQRRRVLDGCFGHGGLRRLGRGGLRRLGRGGSRRLGRGGLRRLRRGSLRRLGRGGSRRLGRGGLRRLGRGGLRRLRRGGLRRLRRGGLRRLGHGGLRRLGRGGLRRLGRGGLRRLGRGGLRRLGRGRFGLLRLRRVRLRNRLDLLRCQRHNRLYGNDRLHRLRERGQRAQRHAQRHQHCDKTLEGSVHSFPPVLRRNPGRRRPTPAVCGQTKGRLLPQAPQKNRFGSAEAGCFPRKQCHNALQQVSWLADRRWPRLLTPGRTQWTKCGFSPRSQ